MKALSIQQPWAWAILNAGKDIENRRWYTSVRGRVLIHAGKKYDIDGRDFLESLEIIAPEAEEIEMGGIVGSVSIDDCVQNSGSRWFFGPYGFLLRDPAIVPFKPYRGQLGFFEVLI